MKIVCGVKVITRFSMFTQRVTGEQLFLFLPSNPSRFPVFLSRQSLTSLSLSSISLLFPFSSSSSFSSLSSSCTLLLCIFSCRAFHRFFLCFLHCYFCFHCLLDQFCHSFFFPLSVYSLEVCLSLSYSLSYSLPLHFSSGFPLHSVPPFPSTVFLFHYQTLCRKWYQICLLSFPFFVSLPVITSTPSPSVAFYSLIDQNDLMEF